MAGFEYLPTGTMCVVELRKKSSVIAVPESSQEKGWMEDAEVVSLGEGYTGPVKVGDFALLTPHMMALNVIYERKNRHFLMVNAVQITAYRKR